MGRDELATFARYRDQHQDRLDRQIPGSRAWPYDDVPIGPTRADPESCPHGTCASTQIPRQYRVLSDAHESKPRQPVAVLVLTHVVGDLHQPLHAADHDDRGGNQLKIRLPNGRKMNLLWGKTS
jgi:hypothetical protein